MNIGKKLIRRYWIRKRKKYDNIHNNVIARKRKRETRKASKERRSKGSSWTGRKRDIRERKQI